MIVVDVAVLACALVDSGPDGVLVRSRLAGETVLVPEGTDLAVCAVLRRLVDIGTLTPGRAAAAVTDLRDLPLERVPQWPFLARAWALRCAGGPMPGSMVTPTMSLPMSPLHPLAAAVAEAYGVPLVTGEAGLARPGGLPCAVELLP